MGRWWLPIGGAVLGASAALAQHLGSPQNAPDFRHWWLAAGALLSGENPYQFIRGPVFTYPFVYPLTASILVLPLAPIPLLPAHVLWSGIGGGLLGLACVRRPALSPALISLPFLEAAAEGHWSPVLVAACALPALQLVWAAKPSVGAAYFAGFGSRQAALAGLALTAISLIILPRWPLDWVHALRSSTSVSPITRPGGFLLLLGLARWRTAEGRLLATLALVPQTTVPYEALATFLCARTRREGYVLAVLADLAVVGHYIAAGVPNGVPEQARTAWPWLLAGCYVPALTMLLRPIRVDHAQPG